MCTVSMVGDHYSDIFKQKMLHVAQEGWSIPSVSRQEFDDLRRQVEEMKALLVRAKEYDERNNEPHCEMEDKVALLKQVAKLVGVSLEDVFGKDGE